MNSGTSSIAGRAVARDSKHPDVYGGPRLIIDNHGAETIARKFLTSKGIELIGSGEAKHIKGSLREKHLPGKPEDYWLVTFQRSTALVDGSSPMNAEELEILTAVAEANESVTVAVEMDGTAEVV
ncbi:MAG: hypothetical protein U1A77_04795 [Pirellulales bacterium]